MHDFVENAVSVAIEYTVRYGRGTVRFGMDTVRFGHISVLNGGEWSQSR